MSRTNERVRRAASGAGRARALVGVGLVGVVLLASPGTAAAVPPPPPNPSDSQLSAASSAASQQAGQVGQLIAQLTSAQNQLTQLQNDVELKQELANKARVDLQTAQDGAAAAQAAKTAADAQVATAQQKIDAANTEVDRFAASSYQQGSTVGGVSAYLGSASPEDVLARAQLLDAVSSSELDVLASLDRAHTVEANAASAALQAQQAADAAQQRATAAKSTADTATATAVSASQSQAQRARTIMASETDAQTKLDAARANVNGLQGQRAAFEAWDAQRKAEEAAAAERQRQAAAAAAAAAAAQQRAEQAAAAARASSSRSSSGGRASAAPVSSAGGGGGGGSSSGGGSAPAGSSVAAVIARAESQLGVTYAWGGGNAYGPTYGVRDGGVADSYGDYNRIGFDCSGLMIYAFAGVRALPHYTGYQYQSGPHVPSSQMQAGDLIFYGNAGIHHVALYIGNGLMVEAPHSGSQVKISSVYYDDMLPYVVRLL